MNHLPYMPFPPNWPVYIPKDKLASWFEAYAEAMELNYWTDTEFQGGSYDGRWTVTVSRGGEKRVMHPRHVVMATGVSGIPNIPDIPALRGFKGNYDVEVNRGGDTKTVKATLADGGSRLDVKL